jgi:Lecithin:cholesterol acyltransferase
MSGSSSSSGGRQGISRQRQPVSESTATPNTTSIPGTTEVWKPHLPVIIFPGFMSSGLYVKKSSIAPGWEGKRLWINLSSLGIHSIRLGGDVDVTANASDCDKKNNHIRLDDEDNHQSPSNDGGNNGRTDNSSARGAKDVDGEERFNDTDDSVNDSDYNFDDGNSAPNSNKTQTSSTQQKNEAEGRRMRSLWLQHIMLQPDMVTEPDGVEVRNIEGLAGVDYLSPGALTSYVSYVFGPVIDVLRQVGYDDNSNGDNGGNGSYNLDASPYDWRLPPHYLEKRDGYMTRTMQKIEKLYSANDNTPVVMVCHSLGCKTGHYFLNYVEKHFGRAWIDKHIHTYLPVGAPHLGAPSAVRSLISGEKMGLDTFLSDAESLAFGRTIGSGPFLLPSTLPTGAPPNVFLRREGALEVWLSPNIHVQPIFQRRLEGQTPSKLKLTLVYNNKHSASSTWTIVEGDVESLSQTVTFGEKFTFSVPPDGPPDNARLTILLCEPGVRTARTSDTMLTRAHQMGRHKVFTNGVWEYNGCDWCAPARSFVMNFPGSSFLRMLCCCPIVCPVLKWFVWPIVYCAFMIYLRILYVVFWVVFK